MSPDDPVTDHHSCCDSPSHLHRKKWYRSSLFLVCFSVFLILTASFYFPFLLSFRASFLYYLKMIGWPVALGFILGGLIDYYIPKEYISKYLAHKSKKTIFLSVSLGLIMSACSHGIIALSMEIYKKGASGPAVVSFLLASPWANLPVTFLLVGFFGWKGFLIIFAALFVAVTTGLFFQFLDRKGWIERNKNSVEVDPTFSISQDISSRFSRYHFSMKNIMTDIKGVARGIFELAEMILWWIMVGIILASFASAFVPHTVFRNFLGPSFKGLLVTLVVATLLEVCSEGTSPIAFEIYKQTGALGNAFAFLMGGVVTDYTEIGLVWMNLGRRTALWMIAVTVPQVFLLGWIFNTFVR